MEQEEGKGKQGRKRKEGEDTQTKKENGEKKGKGKREATGARKGIRGNARTKLNKKHQRPSSSKADFIVDLTQSLGKVQIQNDSP